MTYAQRLTSRALALALLAAFAAGCGAKNEAIPVGAGEPDKFLFDRGRASLDEKKWLASREYFRRIIDSYPQSELRPEAKLAIGDSYLGEGSGESLVLAANEFREFMSFYPTHPRSDYAQYRLGMVYFKQMRSPQRDQTETREAVREFETFLARYPNSALKPEVEAKLREARDRSSMADYQVGVFYYKQRWYPGAIDRLRALLKSDPTFTFRDGAYYYLAEALLKVRLDAEALPLLEKLVAEFEQSEFLEKGTLRLAELKANMAKAGAPPVNPADAATPATPPPATPSGPPQAGAAVEPKL
jgi:outer membrane protein assembly factor BamD